MKTSEERLLHVCEGAKKAAERYEDKWAERMWEFRIEQVKAKRVTERDFAHWLRTQADYWSQKDREFADYLIMLAGRML
jgi:hypothetical protein